MGTSDHGAGSGSGSFVDGAPSYAANRSSNHEPAPPVVNKQLWLDAWNDPVAGISAYTPCIHACNLMGDGDYRLIVADGDRKLKVSTPTKDTNVSIKNILFSRDLCISEARQEDA